MPLHFTREMKCMATLWTRRLLLNTLQNYAVNTSQTLTERLRLWFVLLFWMNVLKQVILVSRRRILRVFYADTSEEANMISNHFYLPSQ